jgi:hypothetical protein
MAGGQSPSTNQHDEARLPNPDEVSQSDRSSFANAEQFIQIAGLAIHVIAIIFAVVEILPHFIPEPSLVWSMDSEETPNFETVVFNFRNPSGSVPLEQFEAHWKVGDPQVQLAVAKLLEPHDLESVTPDTRTLKVAGSIPAGSNFTAYLHADHHFDILSQDFRAAVPKITQAGVVISPAEVISQQEWATEESRSRFRTATIVVLLLATIIGINRLSSLARKHLTVRPSA